MYIGYCQEVIIMSTQNESYREEVAVHNAITLPNTVNDILSK